MSGNGSSYQKDGGPSYQSIPSSGHDSDVEDDKSSLRKKVTIGTLVLAVIAGVIYAFSSHGSGSSAATVAQPSKTGSQVMSTSTTLAKNGKLKLFDDQNRFVVEDFDVRSTFSSFLPAVAGYFGKPVWAFYVNRGQGIATFGTESKDFPILEFNPANKAYQVTPFVGFRSFVRGTRNKEKTSFDVEPFAPATSRILDDVNDDPSKPKRIMFVGTNEMEVEEIDSTSGLKTSALYFVLPEEDFGSLIRRATYTNIGDSDLTIDILDGLARIEPFGGALDWALKNMGRTLEGWMGVKQIGPNLTLPFFKMSTEPSDTASVKIEEAGHYCIAFIESPHSRAELLPIVFDTSKVFGKTTSLQRPSGLLNSSVSEILSNPQYGDAKTSSAFAAVTNLTLAPGQNITIASVYGKALHSSQLSVIAKVVTAPGFVEKKFRRARVLIDDLTSSVETVTVNPLFNGAVKQMFLDNSLRGGVPTIMGLVDSDATYDDDKRVKIFHAFSRIHGDLERDYNAFDIVPQYFSQGPGNYRDIAQNRRDDVTFVPRLASFDIQMFLSYIQADGYEPLTVEAVAFLYGNHTVANEVAKSVTSDAKSAKVLGNVLMGGPFRPGQLFDLCEQLNINISVSNWDFINALVGTAEDTAMAVYGSGYWGDHWDYYMDLIDSYIAIFPDKEEHLMYDTELRYFFSTATVQPRSRKYVLTYTYDGKSKHVLQLDATFFDKDKVSEQQAFLDQNTGLLGIGANWQRTTLGTPMLSSPIAKLFLLGSVKFAMRDSWGMGIEYEGGRPGWNDAMNGLPGQCGSGMPETYELYLLLKYVKKVVDKYDRPVVIPDELHKMITTVNESLDLLEESGYEDREKLSFAVPKPLFEYWDVVASARENYRNDVQYYFSGNTTSLDARDVSDMITRWLEQIEIGMGRAIKFGSYGAGDDGKSGIPPAYFSYNVTSWELNDNKNAVGLPLVNAMSMSVGTFPLFLEGPVRYMKIIQNDNAKMKDMYQRVLNSGLRDNELKMYFLSASLVGQSYDMGRMMAFAPGWLENQSIWMHMSYKYYLQLLRGKLYDEFFWEMKNGGILPFMDPTVYGRSLMECSSFIASSAFPDSSMHGEGFLARLSGSTAEFLSIWKLMFIGPKPFFLNRHGQVVMQLVPALPSWLFEDETADSDPMFDEAGNHIVKFKLFATIMVTYHNPGGDNLYGVHPKSYNVTMKHGDVVSVDGSIIPTKTAIAIRKVSSVKSIDAYF